MWMPCGLEALQVSLRLLEEAEARGHLRPTPCVSERCTFCHCTVVDWWMMWMADRIDFDGIPSPVYSLPLLLLYIRRNYKGMTYFGNL